MKRFFALAALVLGLAACQTEPEGLDVNVGGEVDTTITVSLPDTETRATDSAEGAFKNVVASDEYTIRYILQVFYKGNESHAARQVIYSDNKVVSFPVRLVPGRDYNFVVWADVVMQSGKTLNELGVYDASADLHYNTANLKSIELKGEWNAMDETRDAFTGHFDTAVDGDKTPYNGAKSINIPLTRPFAKLRIITTDMEQLNDLGIEPKTATVEYTVDHYNAFNAFAGKVIGDSKNRDIKHENFAIKAYDDNVNDKSKVLFTDYFFAADEEEVVNFNLSVYDQDNAIIGETINFNTPIPARRNYLTTISGNILTDGNNIKVEVEDAFDGYNTIVDSAALAQEALDNAAPNTTIYLEPGVDYGTLLIRPVAGASNTTTDCDYLVYRNEMLRKVENLTIIGAPGATVDAIKVVAGYVENSGSTGYVVDIKNLVIDSVEFNDTYTNAPHSYAAPIFFDLTYTNVDGLTVKNCKLEGNNAKMNFVYLYGSGNPSNSTFETAAKNITITGNTVDGIARLCELRQAENVTITNNTIKNTYLHGMLLSVDGGTYSGNVTITNNTADGIKERFVRMAGAGDAVVVIKDNTIIDYKGADANIIKVTDGTNVTIENNSVMTRVAEGVSKDENGDFVVTAKDGLQWFTNEVNNGNTFENETIKLANDIDLEGTTFYAIGYNPENNSVNVFEGTFDGNNKTIKGMKRYDNTYAHKRAIGLFASVNNATIKNVKLDDFVAATYGGEAAAITCVATGTCVFENITLNNGSVVSYNNDTAGIVGWANVGNFTFKNITIGSDVTMYSLWDSYDTTLGGIVGTLESPSTVTIDGANISCKISAFNDVCGNYQWYAYRRTGMVIGNMDVTKTENGKTTPDPASAGVTCRNVVVNYGDWMNYHYCEFEANGKPSYAEEGEWKFSRVEGSEWGREDDIDTENCTHDTDESHNLLLPVDQLFGGGQGVYGLREYEGVTVNYPASYRREVSSAAALTEALGKGVSVILDADIDFGSTQLAITGENQVVDLGGHALTTANNWGGISLKNGATIKNGTITHAGNTAAIKAFNGTSVENVTINATCTTADKTVTGIAVQQGAHVESIKDVTINGVSQGIEVGYQATVDLIENAVVNESNNGTAKGIGLVINGGMVGKAKDCTFKGETYGITLHLKGVFAAGLNLENCKVEGTTCDLYTWDEKGISNTSGSLVLTYDDATEQKSGTDFIVADFEQECAEVVSIQKK